EIELLVDLVAASRVSAVTVEAGGRRVTIEKGAAPPQPAAVAAAPSGAMTAPTEAPTRLAEAGPDTLWIKAPMVGVFHHVEPPVLPVYRIELETALGLIGSMTLLTHRRQA